MVVKLCVSTRSSWAGVRWTGFLFAVVLLASSSLSPLAVTPAVAVEPDIPEKLLTEADALAVIIRQKAADKATAATSATDDRQAISQFYAERGGKPAWIDGSGLNARARDVMAEIRKAGDWGLQASAYELPEPQSGAHASVDAAASAEIKLSQAVLKYARHARGGRFNPSDLTKNLDVTAQLFDPKSVLASMVETDGPAAYLRRLHPRHPQFEKLRQAYLAARGGARGEDPVSSAPVPQASGASIQIPPGPRLRPGQSHPHVALLRQRLGMDPLQEAVYFDEALAAAVEDFQRKNGVNPDAALTNGLREALNRSGGRQEAGAGRNAPKPAERTTGNAARLLANMERWRYVPEDMGRLHVWVNVPEYMVRVVKDGQVIHSERIVAGKTDTQTAIFSAPMQEVIFNPSWNVPMSIKVKEIQPNLSRSPAILAKQGLRIKVNGRDIDPGTVDWGSADMRNYHFYQPPGGQNVLGIVKFAFPNKHDIYMHDTPSKSLFNSEVRTFSHGCMRVRDPRKLAEVLLREDKGWDSARVGQSIGGPEEVRIGLSRKIPVHVTYFTAFVDDSGKLATRSDIYGHDTRISDALAGKPIALIAQSDPVLIQEKSVQEAKATMLAKRTQRREAQQQDNGGGSLFSWLLN
jgi:L,D-transpeptidase YcbB